METSKDEEKLNESQEIRNVKMDETDCFFLSE